MAARARRKRAAAKARRKRGAARRAAVALASARDGRMGALLDLMNAELATGGTFRVLGFVLDDRFLSTFVVGTISLTLAVVLEVGI